MIGDTKKGKREFREIEEDDGAYVSKPGTNACMASNHKSLHECLWIVTGGILNVIQQNCGRRKNHWVYDNKESQFEP